MGLIQSPITRLISVLTDLQTDGSTVIDEDVADTLIADIAKPANPQYTRTITSANLPSFKTGVMGYFAILTIGGKNNHATLARTINYRETRNGVEVGADQSLSIPALNFWLYAARYRDADIAANDVLGVKLWGSVANDLDYRYVTVYLVPRQWVVDDTIAETLALITTNDLVRTGAIAGVSYTNQVAENYQYADQNASSAFTADQLGNPTLKGMTWGLTATTVTESTSSNAASRLFGYTGTRIRYLRRVT